MPDITTALVNFLSANSSVTSLVGGNIFDTELPTSADLSMPTKAIVIDPHGGPDRFIWLQLHEVRFNLWCYGETYHLAYVVYETARLALKGASPLGVWANTYLHWCNPDTGPIPHRDPTLQWPYNLSSWLVRASDLTVT
jgi:hypothetical protein